jgi:hypothetical protein
MSYIGKTPTSVPLTSSDITDGIISLPKLTDGTDGNLISYDASGNPVAVATGTDGQVLTSAGAGAPPAFEALPAGGSTAPYCSVYRNGNQTLSDATHTKIQFNVENVDSGGAFDSSTNYRYTPQTSGYYFVSVNLGTGVTADNAVDKILLTIYKNGSGITGALGIRDWDTVGINYNDQVNTSVIVQMNGSSDYIEAFAYIDVTSGTPRVESQQASMHIFKMTE